MNPSVKQPILEHILKTIHFQSNNAHFQLLPLDFERDLPIVFDWVNQPYAIPFWGMNGPKEQLEEAYATVVSSKDKQSVAVCLNKTMIGQLDLYDPFEDPIAKCYSPQEGDIGIHLLMAPGKKPVKDFTAKILYHILSYLFVTPQVQRIIGEPDERNEGANKLLHKLSFEFRHSIQLPYKVANLYTITKAQFSSLPSALFLL